jgi:DNA helicase-2/ATP-dependent DNA helicase PcrA
MTGLVLNTKKFVPSPQQADFFNWIQTAVGSAVLEAVAGAGKTTTLIKALGLMSGTIFFGAFNKKIADEIQARAPGKDGLTISTMHAAGLRAWRKAAGNPVVDADKVRDIFRGACVRNIQYKPFEQQVLQLVSLAKQAGFGIDGFPSLKSASAWENLVDHFDIETYNETTKADNRKLIIQLSIKTLEASIARNFELIDFNDMIYAPLLARCKFDQYDWVLLDEAQDTNATRRALALAMLKEGGRLVAVGDRHQAIYGFTGADAKALDMIAEATNATRLPLTVTYRCPKAIVAHAHQWVKHIEAHESAPDGIVREAALEDLAKEAQPGDAILCRLNAPLIEHVYKFVAAGIPAMIEGREIGKGLEVLAKRWKAKHLDELLDKLQAYYERESAKLKAKEQLVKIDQLEDKVECLKVIIERVRMKNPETRFPVEDVVAEINAIFADVKDLTKVVLLSSIHKSKGREWRKVIWLTTNPSKRAKLDWMKEQEMNLKYVATTRAMHELVLISSGK